MPALNFTQFTDNILSGEKCQTVRLSRKHPIKRGNKLYLYTGMRTKGCKKLGEAVCSKVVPIKLNKTKYWVVIEAEFGKLSKWENGISKTLGWEGTNKLAREDGFDGYYSFADFFINTYKLKPGDSKEFNIIKWRDFVPAGEGQGDEANKNKISTSRRKVTRTLFGMV